MVPVLLTTREAAWYIISLVSVCLSVCQTITFDSLDVESSYLHIPYISREYGPRSYMKVIGSRLRLQDQKGIKKSPFPQCEILIGRNSGSVKQGVMHFACIMGFFGYGRSNGVTVIFVT